MYNAKFEEKRCETGLFWYLELFKRKKKKKK